VSEYPTFQTREILGEFTRTLKVTIRPCRESDLPSLEWHGWMTLQREVIRATYQRYERGEVLMLVAESNQCAIGQAWIDLIQKGSQLIGILWAIRVIPPLQRMGIGSMLIATAEDFLLKQGFRSVELGVEKTNPEAFKLYTRLKYQCVGQEVAKLIFTTPEGIRVEERIDQWILRKELPSC